MKNTHRYSIIILTILIMTGPFNLYSQKHDKDIESLMTADRNFSAYSVEKGMNSAFFEFADTSVVLLKPDMYPIKGMEALREYHAGIDDSKLTLSWEPYFARVSKSGDLGYTYGIWKLKAEDGNFNGTYVTIWIREKKGDWKFVLDTGNGGLGE